MAQRSSGVRARACCRSRSAVALDDVVALLSALQVLEHVLAAWLVRVGVWVAGAGPGAEVALARDDGVRERRRALERLKVRRAAALGWASCPGACLGGVPEAVLDVPADDALRLRLRQRPDADVRLVRRRAQEADAA